MARCTIEFNDAADKELSYLSRRLGIKSKSEIVRNALSLYTFLADQLLKPGRSLGIVVNEGYEEIETLIAVPGFSSLREEQGPKFTASAGDT